MMDLKNIIDTHTSIIVKASAGSGKTTLLVLRVLNLLLHEKNWRKILCITFTKIAAQEMLLRVNNKLQIWSNMSTVELSHDIVTTLHIKPTEKILHRAASLFKQYCHDNNAGIRIYTIHAFAQYILQNFAYEANLQPYFSIIDENHTIHIANDIFNDIQIQLNNSDTEYYKIQQAVHDIMDNTSITQMKKLIQFIIFNVNVLKDCYSDKKYIDKLKQKIQFDHNSITNLNIQISHLINQIKNHNDDIDIILSKFAPNIELHHSIRKYFFTQTGSLRKKIVTKDNPCKDTLIKIQEFIAQYQEAFNTKKLLKLCIALQSLGNFVINKYEQYKQKHNYLSYDDLIYHTYKLVNYTEMKDWVLYKLDNKIDHVLVDEAQDTSILQWKIIDCLIEDFFTHDSNKKSVFIVGDSKQSVYSFQGANLFYFHDYLKHLQTQFKTYDQKYKITQLDCNYRSNETIVNFLKGFFDNLNIDIFSQKDLFAIKQHPKGGVEIWEYDIATKEDNTECGYEKFANMIISHIHKLVQQKIFLPSTGKPVRYKDFAILLQRRSPLIAALHASIEKYNIINNDSDRVLLKSNPYIMNIISAMKFVLSPLDDYRLAVFLKSFGVNDEQLYYLIHNQRQYQDIKHLWEYIIQHNNPQIITIKERIQYIIKQSQKLSIVDFLLYLTNEYDSTANDRDVFQILIGHVLYFIEHFSSSMEEFTQWFDSVDIVTKNNQLEGEGIFISTIHGSKGLEFPITILADTTSMPVNHYPIILNDGECFFYNIVSQHTQELKKAYNHNAYLEYIRLLYVGMTRAQDHLIICGEMKKSIHEKSWYMLLHKHFQTLSNTVSIQEHNFKRILSNSAELTNNITYVKKPSIDNNEIINIKSPKQQTHDDHVPHAISSSPLINNTGLRYGGIVHRILEDMINNNIPIIEHSMLNLFHRDERVILHNKIKKSLSTIKPIIQNADNLLTEVSYAFNGYIGVVDCMVFKNNDIHIIEYKSDKNVTNQIPDTYYQQICKYIAAIQDIYPSYNIKASLLWVETGELVHITPK